MRRREDSNLDNESLESCRHMSALRGTYSHKPCWINTRSKVRLVEGQLVGRESPSLVRTKNIHP